MPCWLPPRYYVAYDFYLPPRKEIWGDMYVPMDYPEELNPAWRTGYNLWLKLPNNSNERR